MIMLTRSSDRIFNRSRYTGITYYNLRVFRGIYYREVLWMAYFLMTWLFLDIPVSDDYLDYLKYNKDVCILIYINIVRTIKT